MTVSRNLSRRERQVVELVADGHTDVQIANRLDLTPPTVRAYLRWAREKLGASNRAHCAVLAIRQGIIK